MAAKDQSHLEALRLRLSHERGYLADDEANERLFAVTLRKVWIAQIEKEIANELAFLGITESDVEMSDEELLAELMG